MQIQTNLNELSSAQHPQNFSFARTVSVRTVGAHFFRVRVESTDLFRFSEASLHFRIVLPPQNGRAPVWPWVGIGGQTEWPKGDDALHRPAYTIRDIDYDAGWLDFDVNIHEGGRVSNWARTLKAGHVIGLAGPGGPPIPEASDILLAGDETAMPAIARIMSSEMRPRTGEVFIYSDAQDYDFEVPESYNLHWLSPAQGAEAFIERLASTPRADDTYVWFGGERSIAQTLRSYFHGDCGIAKDASYISAYWRRAR